MAPFMLLRHLPRLPRTGHSLSDPPLEPELSYIQRRIVRDAHSQISLYDVGWRRNFAQVFGWNRKYGWVHRIWYGGAWYVFSQRYTSPVTHQYSIIMTVPYFSMGDGKTFPRNPRSEDVLVKLAQELVKADADR